MNVGYSKKSRCPLLEILLPVVINFIARRYKFHCPWFFTPLPVVFYADGRENLRRRPSLFSPVLIQQRPDLCWEATVRAEALGLEGVSAPSSHTEIKNAL